MMTISIDGETFLDTTETCSALGVSRETLNRYVKRGLLRRYKRGLSRTAYYKEAEVDNLARKRFEMREEDQ